MSILTGKKNVSDDYLAFDMKDPVTFHTVHIYIHFLKTWSLHYKITIIIQHKPQAIEYFSLIYSTDYQQEALSALGPHQWWQQKNK